MDNEKTEIPDTISSDALSAEEQAYFDSGGEKVPGEAPAPDQPESEKPEAAVPENAEPQADAEPEVQKLVPHGAFEEERRRRKDANRQLEAERIERAKLQGQLDALRAGKTAPDATPQQQANAETDPIGAIKALEAKLAEKDREAETMAAERAAMDRVSAIGQRHAERFAKAQPHFLDSKDAQGNAVKGAYTFIREAAAQRLAEQYPNASPDAIQRAVNAAEAQHIEACVRDGINAAEKLYELALEAGYKPPTAQAAAAPRAPNGQFKSEAEKVADREAAQKASRSLGSVPAGGGEAELSIEALSNMDDDEFAAATAGGGWEKLHRKGVI